MPAPEKVCDSMQRVAVEREEPDERIALDVAQQQRPAEADRKRERNVPGRERKQPAIRPGLQREPDDPGQREQGMRQRIVQDERKGADDASEREAIGGP